MPQCTKHFFSYASAWPCLPQIHPTSIQPASARDEYTAPAPKADSKGIQILVSPGFPLRLSPQKLKHAHRIRVLNDHYARLCYLYILYSMQLLPVLECLFQPPLSCHHKTCRNCFVSHMTLSQRGGHASHAVHSVQIDQRWVEQHCHRIASKSTRLQNLLCHGILFQEKRCTHGSKKNTPHADHPSNRMQKSDLLTAFLEY